jgi:hypothetical protein
VVELLVRNVLSVNIEIPKVVKGAFWGVTQCTTHANHGEGPKGHSSNNDSWRDSGLFVVYFVILIKLS